MMVVKCKYPNLITPICLALAEVTFRLFFYTVFKLFIKLLGIEKATHLGVAFYFVIFFILLYYFFLSFLFFDKSSSGI